ncbi:hypothetical protein GCM10027088_39530 [Nocardia goodfellowii]
MMVHIHHTKRGRACWVTRQYREAEGQESATENGCVEADAFSEHPDADNWSRHPVSGWIIVPTGHLRPHGSPCGRR